MSDQSAPEWIVTFSDIVSLLVTFFILLLTWSTLEKEKFEMIVGSLQGALGVASLSKDEGSIEDKPQLRNERADGQGTDEPTDDRSSDEAYQDMAIRLKKSFGEAIEFDKLRKGYRIRITAGTLFRPGSAELLPACRRGLKEIARAVAPRYNPIRVDGHTDVSSESARGRDGEWELSVARATSAARFLADEGGIEAPRISVAGYGSTRPAYRGEAPAAQARNRRIEIVILDVPKRRG